MFSPRIRAALAVLKRAGAWGFAKAQLLDARDVVILAGLLLLWSGLREVYAPSGQIAVGAFLLWFTTIRRVPEP